MAEPLLILGASARAAAQSAARLGLRPLCGDLFRDADLPEPAIASQAKFFPGDLLRIAERMPPAPWIYTGGLENYPALVARVSRRHGLLGTPPEALARVRDPYEVARVICRAGLLFPQCRPADERVPADGTWMIKHRRSSGGLRVQVWRGQSGRALGPGWYFQQLVDGLPISAVYLAVEGHAQLLGVSEQCLTGSDARPFQYAGSLGPLRLPPDRAETVRSLGHLLASEFELQGLFGLDLIDGREGVWAIEINPRYTASVEVLERALRFNAIQRHLSACRDRRLLEACEEADECVVKSLVYAPTALAISEPMTRDLLAMNQGQRWPLVADVPRAGTKIASGQPVLTLLAAEPNRTAVLYRLQSQATIIRRVLHLPESAAVRY